MKPTFNRAKKKKNPKKLFSPYKIIDFENFIKVSQNPNKVARDTQGLPTVPHNDVGGLNFKGLVSKYLFVMITSPYKITFSQKKSNTRYPDFGKDLGFGIIWGGAELKSGLLFYFAFLVFELQPKARFFPRLPPPLFRPPFRGLFRGLPRCLRASRAHRRPVSAGCSAAFRAASARPAPISHPRPVSTAYS